LQVRVVVFRARDRLREDRGVGRQSGDPPVPHEFLESPRVENAPIDEVQPWALARLDEACDAFWHYGTSTQYTCVHDGPASRGALRSSIVDRRATPAPV